MYLYFSRYLLRLISFLVIVFGVSVYAQLFAYAQSSEEYIQDDLTIEDEEGNEGQYSQELLVKVNKFKDISIGKADAPVVIYEYLSLTCPHCGSFHKNVFSEIKKKYIDTGKVKFIIREFPLDGIAYSYAVLARCADNKKFFAIHDILLKEQEKWAYANNPLETYKKYAKRFGFTTKQYNSCIKNDRILNNLYDSVDMARADLSISATPTFFINGMKFSGGLSGISMSKIIDAELAKNQ